MSVPHLSGRLPLWVEVRGCWTLEWISPPAQAARAAVRPDGLLKQHEKRSAQFSLDIYARGYLARLLRCLEAEFPALRAFVGEQAFGLFAHGYISAKPPTSPSLIDPGAGLADYLEQARPRPVGPPDAPDDIPSAIAGLERARADAQHAHGVENDLDYRQVDLLDLISPTDLYVRTPASLHLVRASFALTDVLAAAERGEGPCTPPSRATFYAIARNHFRVRVYDMSAWQHAFLEACTDSTERCAAVVARAGTAVGADAEKL